MLNLLNFFMKIFKVFFFLFVGVLSSFSQSKIIFQDTVLFAYNQAALNATAEAKLERLIEQFRTETSTHFELWGRASSEGDIAYNQALSERRTKSVEAYLLSKGVFREKISTESYGEIAPITENETEMGRAMNRSVIIKVTTKEKILESPTTLSLTESLSSYKKANNENIFEIVANRDTSIVCKHGTIVKIPADAFPADVSLRIEEYLTASDFILNDLHADSNEGMLETGGMFYIEAIDRKGTVYKKANKPLELRVPIGKPVNEMKIYRAKDRKSKWELNQNAPNVLLVNNNTSSSSPSSIFTKEEIEQFNKISRECSAVNTFLPSRKKYVQPSKTVMAGYSDLSTNMKNKFIEGVPVEKIPKMKRKKYRELVNYYTKKMGEYEKNMTKDSLDYAKKKEIYDKKLAECAKNQTDRYKLWDSQRYIGNVMYNKYYVEQRRKQDSLNRLSMERLKTGNLQNANDVSYYLAQVQDLGWNNIDALYKKNAPTLVSVKLPLGYDAETTTAKILFKNIRSLMPILPENKDKASIQVPKGQDIMLVFVQIKNGQFSLAIQETNTNIKSMDMSNVKYKNYTSFKEFEKAVSVLDTYTKKSYIH